MFFYSNIICYLLLYLGKMSILPEIIIPTSTLTIIVNDENGGKVRLADSANDANTYFNQDYETNENVTLIAEPRSNYVFKEWKGNNCNEEVISPNSIKLTMDTDKICIAIFEKTTYTATVNIVNNDIVNFTNCLTNQSYLTKGDNSIINITNQKITIKMDTEICTAQFSR